MRASSFLIVALGALLSAMLGRWIDSPWLVPDLTLVGLALALNRAPQRPIGPALFAGCLAMAMSQDHTLIVAFAYVGAGCLIKVLALRWDFAQTSTQLVAVGLVEALLLACLFFARSSANLDAAPILQQGQPLAHMDAQLAASLLALFVARILITASCFPLARRCLGIAH